MAEAKNQGVPAEKDSDPNLAGAPATKPVKDVVAGRMTETPEYDHAYPFQSPKGVQ